MAAASREMGEKSPQRLKDVVSGRQKLPADMLAAAAALGVDIIYVLTGKHRITTDALSEDEQTLIRYYRSLKESDQQAIYQVSETMAAYRLNKDSK